MHWEHPNPSLEKAVLGLSLAMHYCGTSMLGGLSRLLLLTVFKALVCLPQA